MLASMVTRQDREQTCLKLHEYVETARDESPGEMLEEIRRERESYRAAGYFVRVIDKNGHTLFCFMPPRFKYRNCSTIPQTYMTDLNSPLVIKRHDDEDVLEIFSDRLPDGGIIQVGKASTERINLLEKFYQIFLTMALLVTVTGIISGTFMAFKVLAPLRDLIHTVKAITAGSMEARVPVKPDSACKTPDSQNDELDTLATLFNDMLHKIDCLVKGMKESLDYVAHDLRTPVTRLKMIAESTLQRATTQGEFRDALMDCAEEAERINDILSTLMDISEAEAGSMQLDLLVQPVKPVIMDAVEIYEYVAEEKKITISVDINEDLRLPLDSNRFRQVAANLIDNAIKYGHRGGKLTITAQREHEEVLLVFSDDGSGIPQGDLPKIFDRLYRADKSRSQKGLGLGLCMVKAVVKGHGGTIDISSIQGEGTRVTISLPC